MNHVVKLLQDELTSLDTRLGIKQTTKIGLESQAHNIAAEIYQIEVLRKELLNALDMVKKDTVNSFYDEDDLPIRLEGSD